MVLRLMPYYSTFQVLKTSTKSTVELGDRGNQLETFFPE